LASTPVDVQRYVEGKGHVVCAVTPAANASRLMPELTNFMMLIPPDQGR
jgi:hypothetical protein